MKTITYATPIGDIVCDSCGKQVTLTVMEYKYNCPIIDTTIDYTAGYGSKYDGFNFDFHFCTECSDEFLDFLRAKYERVNDIVTKREERYNAGEDV